MSTIWIKLSDWLKIRNGRDILIYSAGQRLSLSVTRVRVNTLSQRFIFNLLQENFGINWNFFLKIENWAWLFISSHLL